MIARLVNVVTLARLLLAGVVTSAVTLAPLQAAIAQDSGWVGESTFQDADCYDYAEGLNRVGSLADTGWIRGLAVFGDYVAAARGELGVTIYDATDIHDMKELATIDVGGPSISVIAKDGYLIVAVEDVGLVFVDVRQPVSPRITKVLDLGPMGTPNAFPGGDFVYVDLNYSGSPEGSLVAVVNVSDLEAPVVEDNWNVLSFGVHDIQVGDGFLVVGNGVSAEVLIADLSDPAHPIERSRYRVYGRLGGVAVEGSRLYLGW